MDSIFAREGLVRIFRRSSDGRRREHNKCAIMQAVRNIDFSYFINLTRNSSTLRPLDLDVQPTFYQFPSIIEREHMPDRSMLVLLSCFRSRQKCRQFVLYLRTSKVHKLKLAFSRNTLLFVPSGNPRSETPHALGIPVQRIPPCHANRPILNVPTRECSFYRPEGGIGGGKGTQNTKQPSESNGHTTQRSQSQSSFLLCMTLSHAVKPKGSGVKNGYPEPRSMAITKCMHTAIKPYLFEWA